MFIDVSLCAVAILELTYGWGVGHSMKVVARLHSVTGWGAPVTGQGLDHAVLFTTLLINAYYLTLRMHTHIHYPVHNAVTSLLPLK